MICEFEKTFNAFWKSYFHPIKMEEAGSFTTYQINNKRFWLIPYTQYQNLPKSNYNDVFIYQDQWLERNTQVKNRLISLAGNTHKINARSCKITKVNKPIANDFFNAHHVLGSCQFKNAFGLYFKDELVAAASFSSPLVMNDGVVPYRSYELLRYASMGACTVVGGLSKLISHFRLLKNPAHLMSYTDNDWGTASSYLSLGFHKKEDTKPMPFWVNPNTNIRTYTQPQEEIETFVSGLNRGNSKWILDLRQT